MTEQAAPIGMPDWLAEPSQSRFAGTLPFNVIALACVLTISAFVVFAPLESAGPVPTAAVSVRPQSAERLEAPSPSNGAGGDTPVASSGSTTTPTTEPPPSSTLPVAEHEREPESEPVAWSGTSLKRAAATITGPATTVGSRPLTTVVRPAPVTSTTEPVVDVATTQPTVVSSTTTTTTTTTTTSTSAPRATTTTTLAAPVPASSSVPPAPTTSTLPPPPQCWDFARWPEAQAAFDGDPTGLAHLDGDGDGLACEHLPGLPPEVPDADDVRSPVTRYFGLHTREAPGWMGEVDQVASAVSKTPNLVMFFTSLSEPYPHAEVEALWNRGMLPVITLEPIFPGTSDGQPELDDLANGAYDSYFTEWATAARAHGKPVVLRFAHEMNGNWYTWAESFPGNEPGDYIVAWRHIHDLFAGIGADNVVWFWNVNRVDTLPTSIGSFYPGDAYVDWVGVSAYYRPSSAGSLPTFQSTFTATLAELRRVAPRKPIVFGETGTAGSETDRVNWTTELFQGMLANADVFGFVWFNEIAAGNDWRIQYSAAVSAAVAAGVADPRYGSGVVLG